MFHITIVACALFVTIVNGNCGPCPEIPKHYEELGCHGIQQPGDCCPERFECPDFLAYNTSQCHFQGKAYDVGQPLDENVGPVCSAACRCSGFSDTATFQCASIECPEFFHGPDSNCVLQHELDKCCSVGKICGADEIKALPKCSLRGNEYTKGELFYPDFAPCHQCLCNEHWDNTTSVPFNKNCKKIDCGIELRDLGNIQAGCIPVYYGTNRCCPIEFRCPTETDAVIKQEGRSEPVEESLSTCKYGKDHLLRIGEHLNSDDKCVECTCRYPPMVDCVKNPECYESTGSTSSSDDSTVTDS